MPFIQTHHLAASHMKTMAHRSSARPLVALAFLLGVSLLAGPATAKPTGEVAVFWGRNKAEGSLRQACDRGYYTTVIISFFSVFGHGSYWADLSGHPLPSIGDDIKHCQSKRIPVFLSLGGGGRDYSLPSSRSAEDVADHLWHAYLGGGRHGVFRPFGDAVLDGIDFFIDHGSPDHYDELARRLTSYTHDHHHHHGGKTSNKAVRLTATPRCAFPDRHAEKALATGLFERLHVRFYGDARCSYNHAGLRGVMEEWGKWTSMYPRSKVFLGLVGANVTAEGTTSGGDMVGVRALYYDLLPAVQKAANYGGIMLWDRYLDEKTYYGEYLKAWG